MQIYCCFYNIQVDEEKILLIQVNLDLSQSLKVQLKQQKFDFLFQVLYGNAEYSAVRALVEDKLLSVKFCSLKMSKCRFFDITYCIFLSKYSRTPELAVFGFFEILSAKLRLVDNCLVI